VAYVDLEKNRLVLKAVLTGPPAVGKTERMRQIGSQGSLHSYGSRVVGEMLMAALPLNAEGSTRPVVIELYEWHGAERIDVRGKALFTGLDGLIYIADAREDRYVDTTKHLTYLLDQAGKSRLQRVPGLLILGRMDEGLLRLPMMEKALEGPAWSERLEVPIEDEARFIEAVRLFGEVMLARTL
jgi:hypothetical protein